MRPRDALVAAALLCAGASGLPAAGDPAETAAEPPVIHLDAIVTDRQGRMIRDLRASDFQLTDDGSARPIEAASLESGSARRLIGLFLDEYHVDQGDAPRVRAALQRFVEERLRPDDLVAVVKPLDQLHAIAMNDDRPALRQAIDSFTGRKDEFEPRSAMERSLIGRSPEAASRSRAQIVAAALQALAIRLGRAGEGRKALVLVTEGLDPGLVGATERLQSSVRGVVYAANRNGVAIYPVDPRAAPAAVPAGGAADSDTWLRTLAEATGGIAVAPGVEPDTGLGRAAADLDAYYLLTYRAAGVGDGRFHAVGLQVKRPGAQVRVRSGYWAPRLMPERKDAMRRASTVPFRPAHLSPLIHTWIGASRAASGLTSISVSWDPAEAPMTSRPIGTVTLKATDDQGRVLVEQPVQGDAVFEAQPGWLHLELTIKSLDGRTLDVDYRTIQAPDLNVARTTIATIQVVRTRNAREFELARRDRAPILAASREFSRAERLLIRVPVYAPAGARPVVRATLLNSRGDAMRPLEEVDGPLPPDVHQFDLSLSSLAPDEYRVELVAGEAAGARQDVRTTLSFRVSD